MKKIDRIVNLWQLDIFGSGENELLDLLKNHLKEEKGLLTVATPNPEQVVLSQRSPEFLAVLQDFDILIPDGGGLVAASKILAKKADQPSLTQRITGVSVVEQLCSWAIQYEVPVLVIGGRDYDSIKNFCPTATWIEGYKVITQPTATEEKAVEATIKKIRPHIVFVAFGAPHQELWVNSHKALLEQNGVKVVMVVGGSFDYLLGKVKRAPKAWQKVGLEWMYRLYQEPWRWRRQVSLLEFMALTAKGKLQ